MKTVQFVKAEIKKPETVAVMLKEVVGQLALP